MLARNPEFLYLILALSLQACTTTPTETAIKKDDIPLAWINATSMKPALTAEPWWKRVKDARLIELIERGLAKNLERKVAEARLQEARALRLASTDRLYPQGNTHTTAQRGNQGYQTGNRPLTLYEFGFDASYEMDLFGSNRYQVEASQASVEAQEATFKEVSLSLAAEIARNYIELRQLQQQALVLENKLTLQKELIKLHSSRFQAGLTNDNSIAKVTALLQSTSAQLTGLRAKIETLKYQIAILLGEQPQVIVQILSDNQPIPSLTISSAIAAPAIILRYRPDVRIAERNLASAIARHESSLAEVYPKITLHGLFGLQKAGHFPLSGLWLGGVQLALPLFSLHHLEGQIKATEARKMQALYTYKQVLLRALTDVETALVQALSQQKKLEALRQVTYRQQYLAKQARLRYNQGITTYLEVIEAEQELASAVFEELAAQGGKSIDAVALYKSLGCAIPAA